MAKEISYVQALQASITYHQHLLDIKAYLTNNKRKIEYKGVDLVHYTQLNLEQMESWNENINIIPEIKQYVKSITEKIDLVVITEAWCLDAAHVLPVVQKFSELNDQIHLKILIRDNHPEVMNKYLTDGSKSIPIVVGIQHENEKMIELFHWGPKPKAMSEYSLKFYNEELGISFKEYIEQTSIWYINDKTTSIQKELYIKLYQSLNLNDANN